MGRDQASAERGSGGENTGLSTERTATTTERRGERGGGNREEEQVKVG